MLNLESLLAAFASEQFYPKYWEVCNTARLTWVVSRGAYQKSYILKIHIHFFKKMVSFGLIKFMVQSTNQPELNPYGLP